MEAGVNESGAVPGRRPGMYLEQFTGLRCLLALWILCGHYMPRNTTSIFHSFTCRSFMAVDVFVVMSGFVTQWTYSAELLNGALRLRHFYVRRFAHIMLTTYVAMTVSVVELVIYRDWWAPKFWQIVRCYFLVEHWASYPGEGAIPGWCPAPTSWTIEVLVPSWLLFPLITRLVDEVESRWAEAGLLALLLGFWLALFGPIFALFVAQGYELSWNQHAKTFFNPPAQIPDFIVGVVAAALARRHFPAAVETLAVSSSTRLSDDARGFLGGAVDDEAELGAAAAPEDQASLDVAYARGRGLLADLAFVVVVAAVWRVPQTSDNCQAGVNPLFDHAFAPVIAVFLYGSASGHGVGGAVGGNVVFWICRQEVLVKLGKYSFEVYLFQWPIANVLHHTFGEGDLITFSMSLFVVFVILTWSLAALYAECVAGPFVRRLRSATGCEVARTVAAGPPQRELSHTYSEVPAATEKPL